ncbi:MAG: hypothetical protein ACJ788_10930 [Ktedonobacteraceae bacterium]|jgi:hypothetical protein
MENEHTTAILLTASTTTGWLNWTHGELWLFPEGLLRIQLDLLLTFGHGIESTVKKEQTEARRFDEKKFHSLISNKRNLWIPRESIVLAYLHRGITVDRLRLELLDGRTVKLLWLPEDNALRTLEAVLKKWLGNALEFD